MVVLEHTTHAYRDCNKQLLYRDAAIHQPDAMESNTRFFQCSKSVSACGLYHGNCNSQWVHINPTLPSFLMPCKLLSPWCYRPAKILQLKTLLPRRATNFKMCSLCPWKQKGMRYIILIKETVRKNTLCPVVNRFKTGNHPKLLADVSSPKLLETRETHTENRCLFGRPDVITYSSMINGYAKVSWVGLGGEGFFEWLNLQRFGIGKNLPCIHVGVS